MVLSVLALRAIVGCEQQNSQLERISHIAHVSDVEQFAKHWRSHLVHNAFEHLDVIIK